MLDLHRQGFYSTLSSYLARSLLCCHVVSCISHLRILLFGSRHNHVDSWECCFYARHYELPRPQVSRHEGFQH